SFADAARTRLADEKIRQLHVVGNFLREADTAERIGQLHTLDTLAQLVIVTAYEDVLSLQPGNFDSPGDSCHLARSITAEHHDAGRQFWVKPYPDALGFTAKLHRTIELGTHDHSRGAKYTLGGMTHSYRLFLRTSSIANQVLPLAFDPEVRRAVGQVGKNSYHWSVAPSPHRVRLPQALQNRVIEVRDHRNHKVGPRVLPITRQQLDDRRLELPNQHLRYPQQRTGAYGKAVFELRVVEVLDANPGQAPDQVGRFEQIAQVDKFDLPGTLLLARRRYQRGRRSAMPTTGVEIN